MPPRPSTRLPLSRSTSNPPQEEEPEAVAFVELLKDAFKKLDENSLKKQRLVARAREKQPESSLATTPIDNPTGWVTNSLSARPLIKTSSASAICPSTKVLQSASISASHPEPRGRALAKTASLGLRLNILSGKSTPTSLPSHTLNRDPKPASAPPLPSRASTVRNANTRQDPTSDDDDTPMQDASDLTETDTEWERPISRADTTMCMQVDDDDDSDTGMDVSFFHAEPPQIRVPVPKPKTQPPHSNTASRPPAPTQRTRTGPPPLGMRRAPLLQPSQYALSQGTTMTVPRFKPPLLTPPGGTTNKTRGGTGHATTSSSRPPPRGGATKPAMAPKAAQGTKDADSSFDVSFDMDVDALEEAMKAYD